MRNLCLQQAFAFRRYHRRNPLANTTKPPKEATPASHNWGTKWLATGVPKPTTVSNGGPAGVGEGDPVWLP